MIRYLLLCALLLSSIAHADTPQLLKDIFPGEGGSKISRITDVNGLVFFFADDSVNGNELWRTDGTESGTELIKDILPGSNSSRSGSHIYSATAKVSENTLIFWANDGLKGTEIWKSNGTLEGTSLIKDIKPGGGSSYNGWQENFAVVQDIVYLVAENDLDDTELWKTDGTESGTTLVKNIAPDTSSIPQNLAPFGTLVVFRAKDGTETGIELWKSDGTESGTVIIKDINTSSESPNAFSSRPGGMTDISGTLFFNAVTHDLGYELWKSDGSEIGTVLVKDINPGPGNGPFGISFADLMGEAVFWANDGVHGFELWKSDGTEGGTNIIKDIAPSSAAFIWSPFFVVANKLFFLADDGIHGIELWVTDGTTEGTHLVKDIYAGETGSSISSMIVVNGILFFAADDGVHGTELWMSDGTTDGTALVYDLVKGPTGSAIGLSAQVGTITASESDLYFVANDGVVGDELWLLNTTDLCELDPAKIDPGICGCGVSDIDSDFDGTPDCDDECPNDATKVAPGQCGCGNEDLDTDNDGTANCIDECPSDPAKIKAANCGCGVADTDVNFDEVPDCNQIGFTINDEAIYTNTPEVVLTVIYPPGAEQMSISNDGGFVASSFISPENVISWILESSGPERLPKTVYIRFLGQGINANLIYTDDIILDEVKLEKRSGYFPR